MHLESIKGRVDGIWCLIAAPSLDSLRPMVAADGILSLPALPSCSLERCGYCTLSDLRFRSMQMSPSNEQRNQACITSAHYFAVLMSNCSSGKGWRKKVVVAYPLSGETERRKAAPHLDQVGLTGNPFSPSTRTHAHVSIGGVPGFSMPSFTPPQK